MLILITICIVTIKNKILKLNKDIRVISMEHKNYVVDKTFLPLYTSQLYDYSLENFFISDIYVDLPDDQMVISVEKDYFNLFEKCINSILHNRLMFEGKWQDLNHPIGLQYKNYIPIVKFAKYSLDYEKYLEKTSQQRFALKVETTYPHFKDNSKYFVVLQNNTCKKRVHILFFIKRAIDLYFNYKNEVNQCLQYNICDYNLPKTELQQEDNTCQL